MKELYLKTEHGLIPLDEKIIEKYKLKVGRKSPFTRCYVVDKKGNYKIDNEEKVEVTVDQMPEGEGLENDEIVEFSETGAILSQSEIIDFSQGTDSDNT